MSPHLGPLPRLVLFAPVAAALVMSCNRPVPHEPPRSEFELIGAHGAIPCEACHGDGEFLPLPTECSACHETDRPLDHYQGDCSGCHTPYGWLDFKGITTFPTTPATTTTPIPTPTTPTTFTHDFLPLVQAHELPCTSCHVTAGDYAGLTNECQACHEVDRPAQHFLGQDCAGCHQPVYFGSIADHPFPIPHVGTDLCITCHADPTQRATVYSCLDGCHPQATTDPLHAGFGTYTYDSVACLGCHPDGN